MNGRKEGRKNQEEHAITMQNKSQHEQKIPVSYRKEYTQPKKILVKTDS